MDIFDVLKFVVQYAVAPFAIMVWSMHKKQDSRIERLEDDTQISKQDIIELKATFNQDVKYMSKNIDEIKEIIQRLINTK